MITHNKKRDDDFIKPPLQWAHTLIANENIHIHPENSFGFLRSSHRREAGDRDMIPFQNLNNNDLGTSFQSHMIMTSKL